MSVSAHRIVLFREKFTCGRKVKKRIILLKYFRKKIIA